MLEHQSPHRPDLRARRSHVRAGASWCQDPAPPAQGAVWAGSTHPGADRPGRAPAGHAGRPWVPALDTSLEALTGEGDVSRSPGWWAMVAPVLAWVALGVGLGAACWLVPWLLP